MSLPKSESRELDPRAMRALAHPLRLTLLELAGLEGSLTATRAATLTGESSASCSFHLRQLAKYGFLEEAEGGEGRERPWRLRTLSHRWSDDEPAEWRKAAPGTYSILHLTPEELTALGEQLIGLSEPYLERAADPATRPEGARPVRLVGMAFPLPQHDDVDKTSK